MRRKSAVYSVCFFCGLSVLIFWLSGSHNHVRFRPYKTEDWILGSLVLLFWGLPLFCLIKSIIKNKAGC
jgi:hypothetical protein